MTTAAIILFKALDREPLTAEEARRVLLAVERGYLTKDYELTEKGWDYVDPGHFEWEGPTCNICDALGHGYPGGGPCPLEERGTYDGPGHAWER